jgi:hypothetical protein
LCDLFKDFIDIAQIIYNRFVAEGAKEKEGEKS